MKRREFIALVGSVAAWPRAMRAQAATLVRIGFLGAVSPTGYANQVAGFRLGLSELGYVEGTNTIIVYRWAEGHYDRLPKLATELVRSNVDVIVTHGAPGTLAAKQATATIPIVAAVIGDPVAAGAVASVGRPGGNITGSSFFAREVEAKRVELLKEVMPHLSEVAYVFNPDNSISEPILRTMKVTAEALKMTLVGSPVRSPAEFEEAFEKIAEARIAAVTIQDDGMLLANIQTIAELVTKRRLLSIGSRELADGGGLIGYGIDNFALFRRAAVFVDKILKGSKPADMPIEQATKFEFVINLKTAATIGIDVPTPTLLRADKVIE